MQIYVTEVLQQQHHHHHQQQKGTVIRNLGSCWFIVDFDWGCCFLSFV